MNLSKEMLICMNQAVEYAVSEQYEYVTPEMLLLMLCENDSFRYVVEECGGNIPRLKRDLQGYIQNSMEKVPGVKPELSFSASQLMGFAAQSAFNSGCEEVCLRHLVHGMYHLEESYATYSLLVQELSEIELLQELTYVEDDTDCLLYTSPSPRDDWLSRMPSSA